MADLATPSGSAADYTGPFEKFATEIKDGFQKCVDKFQEIIDNLNSWKIRIALGALGPAVVYWIQSSLDDLAAGMERLKKFVEELIKHHTPIISLMIQSFEWTNKVKSPVSSLSADTVKPKSDNLYNWMGGDALAYRSKIVLMKDAVDEITARSEFMAKWLFTITKMNVEYVKKLAEIVTFVVGKIVDAAAKAGSVIGLPLLGQTIGDAAGGITEKALNVALQKGVDLIAALGNVRDVEGALDDNTKLPNGAWPQVVRG